MLLEMSAYFKRYVNLIIIIINVIIIIIIIIIIIMIMMLMMMMIKMMMMMMMPPKPAQSAYRRHDSTETSLLQTTNAAYRTMDRGEATILGALDISAAFDMVVSWRSNHPRRS